MKMWKIENINPLQRSSRWQWGHPDIVLDLVTDGQRWVDSLLSLELSPADEAKHLRPRTSAPSRRPPKVPPNQYP